MMVEGPGATLRVWLHASKSSDFNSSTVLVALGAGRGGSIVGSQDRVSELSLLSLERTRNRGEKGGSKRT